MPLRRLLKGLAYSWGLVLGFMGVLGCEFVGFRVYHRVPRRIGARILLAAPSTGAPSPHGSLGFGAMWLEGRATRIPRV